jgi:CRP-like cAMP-binding protein
MHPLRANIERIVKLTDDEFDRVLPVFEKVSYKKGALIIKPGDAVEHEYFLIEGCLKTYYLTDELKMHILQFATPGWWTTDYKAHYGHAKASLYLDCIEASEVLRINTKDRDRICNDIPAIQYFFRTRTNRGYVALQQRVLSLLNNNAKERYEQMLEMYPSLFQKVPRTLIAAYLGVSRETLSRLYKGDYHK